MKLLNDSLQGILYEDDSQIDHSSVAKLYHDEDEEWLYVNIRPSRLNDPQDVSFPVMRHKWGVGPALDIADFIEESVD